MCTCSGVICRMPGTMDVEGDDERTVCHVVYEAKCRETMINYAKKSPGVPLKRASLAGKS